MELNEQRRDLWEVVRKYENQPFVQIPAHKEIHALTKSILHLYETLPLLVTNNNNQIIYFLILFTKIRLYISGFFCMVENYFLDFIEHIT